MAYKNQVALYRTISKPKLTTFSFDGGTIGFLHVTRQRTGHENFRN